MSNLKFVEITKIAKTLINELQRRQTFFHKLANDPSCRNVNLFVSGLGHSALENMVFLKDADFVDNMLYNILDHRRIGDDAFNALGLAVAASCARALLFEVGSNPSLPFNIILARIDTFMKFFGRVENLLRLEESERDKMKNPRFYTTDGALLVIMDRFYQEAWALAGSETDTEKCEGLMCVAVITTAFSSIFKRFKTIEEIENSRAREKIREDTLVNFFDEAIRKNTASAYKLLAKEEEDVERDYLDHLSIIGTAMYRTADLIRSRYLYVPETFLR